MAEEPEKPCCDAPLLRRIEGNYIFEECLCFMALLTASSFLLHGNVHGRKHGPSPNVPVMIKYARGHPTTLVTINGGVLFRPFN